ncbi:MAG: DNA polymerase III subunit alpha [Longimicrobiaceae bacterium]
MTHFAELKAKSAYSFGDGTTAPGVLAERAAGMGYTSMALCDDADLGGIIRFALAAESNGLKPIAGAEIMVDGHPAGLLARDETGYRNLSALVTEARLGKARGRAGISFPQLATRNQGLHVLTGPASGEIASLLLRENELGARHTLARWKEVFGRRLAIEVQYHRVSGDEAALARALIDFARRSGTPWVVSNQPRYLDASGRRVHDLQTALRAGMDYSAALRKGTLLPNGEWNLKSPGRIERLWKGREAGLEESQRIAGECTFSLRWLRPPLPRFPLPPEHDDVSFLREITFAGASQRWGELSARQRGQLEHELAVIARLGFSGFFIIMWDAIRFARSRRILCQGRGSAANSAVAYCLGITAVDPVKHELLFERFLSAARTDGLTEAPDIDVDFEMHRREEVLNYVYTRYSRAHAAITAVTQEYHAPNALQDMGRALGYPAQTIFRLSKRLHGVSPSEGARILLAGLAKEHGLELDDHRGRALIAAVRALDGVPRLRSTHPGGFVLSAQPLGEYMPIEQTTMGRTILQFDKDDLDVVGCPKFDFLGLGGLSATRLAFDAIEARTGTRLEMHQLPEDDPETYEMIARGDTVGTFQIESRAQVQSLIQTKPERLYDLVVQVALIRPGPIQAEFVHPYTRRRRGLEPVQYRHPGLEPILERTMGIPIFQEQAMSISMALGGFTASEADELRRTMGHLRKVPKLTAALMKLKSRMIERGVDEETAQAVVADFRTFANYGFPESHAWSFALISYATAYLKRHYPAEFLLGLLNAWPMGFYAPATLVHDARRAGVEVRTPCMKRGQWDCTLEEMASPARPAVRIGWRHIRGLGKRAQEALLGAHRFGPFTSVEGVIRRAGLSRGDALHLARAGAFEAFEPGRRHAAWEALRSAGDRLPLAPARKLPFDPEEMRGEELIFLDYLATGICVHGHPMEHLRERLMKAGVCSSRELENWEHQSSVVVAGLVVARQHPETANGTVFLLLEDEWGFINVIVPAKLYRKHKEVIKHYPFLVIEGRFEREGPVKNVVGFRYRQLRTRSVAVRSHDFH